MIATHQTDGQHNDYEDRASIRDLKQKLKNILRGMLGLNNQLKRFSNVIVSAVPAGDVFTHVEPIPEAEIDRIVEERVLVRRALGNGIHYNNHCKIVCVDDRMMYVGSDNAYPSYNEEHGVWIEDADEVENWKKKFWNDMWARAVVADD